MAKEKKQVVFEKQVLKDLHELYPDVSQLSKIINQALREHIEKEQLKREQEDRLLDLSEEVGIPKELLKLKFIEEGLEGREKEAMEDTVTKKEKMKEFFCGLWFNHVRTERSEEQLPGREFRYVSSCKCGKNVVKSIPLHDNDLLASFINEKNFPIDENA